MIRTKIQRWIAVSVLLFTVHMSSTFAQQVALKTNLLYDATATPNVGMEIGVGKQHSIQVFYGLHPWKFGHGEDQKYLKHWVVNPEWRHWFCHRFNGSFLGIHAFGGQYNAASGRSCATIVSRDGLPEAASATVTSGFCRSTGTLRQPSAWEPLILTTTNSSAAPVVRKSMTVTRFT